MKGENYVKTCQSPDQRKVDRSEHVLILKGSAADLFGKDKRAGWRGGKLQRIPYGSANAFNVNLSTANVNNNNRTNNNYALWW